MHPADIKIEEYSYELPNERIAKYPLAERDASKLLIYKDEAISESNYRNISEHIPGNTLMVFNQTKVVQARLKFQKETGGVIEVFCLEPHEQYPDVQTAMQKTHKVWWNCIVGGASKWKHGLVLKQLINDFALSAMIVERNDGSFTIELEWGNEKSFAEVLHLAGKVPLPPYLHRDAEQSDEERYQTVYAKNEGSVAAPTAGLHFTDEVLTSLKQKNIETAFVDLHVGAGTFMPVKSETIEGHTMHAEWISADVAFLQKLIEYSDKSVVAVGTTTMRTLESLYWIGVKLHNNVSINFDGYAVTQWEPYELSAAIDITTSINAILQYLSHNNLSRLTTRTQILIAPPYKPQIIKGLVTNFHQPNSTLLLLVASITGNSWKEIYQHALDTNYRFLSYGDGCLLWI